MSASSDKPTVRVDWHCGHYRWDLGVSSSVDYGCEPPDCDTDFTTTESLEDWDARTCSAECPACHSQLSQVMDNPELSDEQ